MNQEEADHGVADEVSEEADSRGGMMRSENSVSKVRATRAIGRH